MNASERIRAALSRSDTTRQATAPPTLEPPAEVETTLPLVTATDQERVIVPKYEDPPARTPKYEDPPVRLPKREKVKPVEADEIAAPVVEVRKEPTPARSRRTPLIIGVVVVAAGLAAFLLRDRWLPIHSSVAPAPAARPLQVDVEMAGSGLIRVVWKTDTAPLAQAREGRLVVTENSQQPRTVPLTLEQLRSGHMDLQSSAERLDFRLEVFNQSGSIASESVRARLPKSAEAPAETAPPQTAQTASQQPVSPKDKPAPKEQAKVDPPPVEKTPDPPPSRPAPRAFTPPPEQTQRPTEEVRTVVLDAPTNVQVANVVKPVAGMSDRMPSAPAPQVTNPASVRNPPPVGGNLQEPKLTKKVAPSYPPLARSLRIEGSVRFTATIRKDGTVANVQLVSGHKMLVQPATDAVRQWIYRPAVLNGKPVEVTTQIDVKFTLNE
jgi:protein TonB